MCLSHQLKGQQEVITSLIRNKQWMKCRHEGYTSSGACWTLAGAGDLLTAHKPHHQPQCWLVLEEELTTKSSFDLPRDISEHKNKVSKAEHGWFCFKIIFQIHSNVKREEQKDSNGGTAQENQEMAEKDQ